MIHSRRTVSKLMAGAFFLLLVALAGVMKMGRFDDAISEYGQAVKLDPHFALSQSKIGTSYILKGQYEEGRRVRRLPSR